MIPGEKLICSFDTYSGGSYTVVIRGSGKFQWNLVRKRKRWIEQIWFSYDRKLPIKRWNERIGIDGCCADWSGWDRRSVDFPFEIRRWSFICIFIDNTATTGCAGYYPSEKHCIPIPRFCAQYFGYTVWVFWCRVGDENRREKNWANPRVWCHQRLYDPPRCIGFRRGWISSSKQPWYWRDHIFDHNGLPGGLFYPFRPVVTPILRGIVPSNIFYNFWPLPEKRRQYEAIRSVEQVRVEKEQSLFFLFFHFHISFIPTPDFAVGSRNNLFYHLAHPALMVRHDSRISSVMGLIFLAICPVLIAQEKAWYFLKTAANYAYYFFAIGLLVHFEHILLEQRGWLLKKIDLTPITSVIPAALRRFAGPIEEFISKHYVKTDKALFVRWFQIWGGVTVMLVIATKVLSLYWSPPILNMFTLSLLIPFLCGAAWLVVRVFGGKVFFRSSLILLILLPQLCMTLAFDTISTARLSSMHVRYSFIDLSRLWPLVRQKRMRERWLRLGYGRLTRLQKGLSFSIRR